MHRLVRILTLASQVALLAAVRAQTADIVVAPDGNDQTGSGSVAAPFATPRRAQAAVRQLREREPQRAGPVRVCLRGGMYAMDSVLAFTPADSGTEAGPVVWSSWPGERAVLSGGVALRGWTVAEGRWQMQLPAVQKGEWNFCQLFVNGQRRERPRLPRGGYFLIEKEISPAAGAKGYDRFVYRRGDIQADWQNLGDVEALCFHSWSMSRLRLGSVDPETRLVTFTGPTCNTSWWAGLPKGHRYLIENVREALGEPGQWYLDRPTGVLTYIPLPGEDPATAVVVAPRLERLVELHGDGALGLWVSHLRFENLTFAHSNWVLPPQGYSYGQAEAGLRGAFYATGARNITLQNCRVTQVGTYAVDFGAGCQDNTIEGCELVDSAAGGLRLGEGWGAAGDAPATGRTVVRNNTVAHGGRLHPAGIGVWIGLAADNLVENNDIFDFYYSGLSVGWTWGYGPTPANHNVIQNNHVYQIGQGVLSDMGGIYTLGLSPGTVIRHNSFHDIDSFDYGGWGIYFDEGSTGIVAEDNLVYRTKTGGFHQHYGKENTVRNNIFAFARVGQIQRTRDESHLGFTFEQNLVTWTEGPLLHGNWNNAAAFALNRNLYWNAEGDDALTFAGQTLEQWQAKGQDRDSVIADPLFVAPAQGDFRLQDGSPAAKIGFKPFSLTGFGRLTPAAADLPAELPRAFPPPPPPPPPGPIEEDFELLAVGDPCPGTQTNEDAVVTEATARVSAEQAAGGKHSLKLRDLPGQKYPWDPHVFFDPSFNGGQAEASFDLYLLGGTTVYHEWRDNHAPYRAGPSLRIRPDGTLTAGERELAKLPLQTWIRFEITWGMTPELAGRFTLKVLAAAAQTAAPMTFADLPCDPQCRALRWFGFCCEGNEAGGYYLDNLRLTPKP
jgi:hypothetical protein